MPANLVPLPRRPKLTFDLGLLGVALCTATTARWGEVFGGGGPKGMAAGIHRPAPIPSSHWWHYREGERTTKRMLKNIGL